jgi:hypothetical protein
MEDTQQREEYLELACEWTEAARSALGVNALANSSHGHLRRDAGRSCGSKGPELAHKLVLKIGPTNREQVKARNCWKLAAEMALEQPEDGLLQSAGGGVESKAVGAAQGQPHGVACECAEVVDQIGVGANRIVSGRLFTWRRQLLAAAVEPWQRGRVRAPRCPDALCSPPARPLLSSLLGRFGGFAVYYFRGRRTPG